MPTTPEAVAMKNYLLSHSTTTPFNFDIRNLTSKQGLSDHGTLSSGEYF